MKGELLKLAKGWTVLHKIYDEGIHFGIDYPLYPDDIAKQEPATLGSYGEVEFEVVDEFTHPELYQGVGWGDGIKYAKLIEVNTTPKIYESPDKGATVYERKAGDYSDKLKLKYTPGKGISAYLPKEITDEEIEKESYIKFPILTYSVMEGHDDLNRHLRDSWVEGIKWYREQLKKNG